MSDVEAAVKNILPVSTVNGRFIVQVINDGFFTHVGDEVAIEVAKAFGPEGHAKDMDLHTLLLDFQGNEFTDKGGHALAKLLGHHASLSNFHVDLSFTQVTDETGVAMSDALLQNTTILSVAVVLNIADGITDKSGVALAKALQNHPSLLDFEFHATGAPKVTSSTIMAIMSAVQDNTKLQSIMLSLGNSQVCKETGVSISEMLQQTRSLKSFSLNFDPPLRHGDDDDVHNEFCQTIVEALQSNKSVQSLTLNYLSCEIFEAVIDLLVALPKQSVLHELSLVIPAACGETAERIGKLAAKMLSCSNRVISFALTVCAAREVETVYAANVCTAIEKMFPLNFVLQRYSFSYCCGCKELVTDEDSVGAFSTWRNRNIDIFYQWKSLAALARCGEGAFCCLTDGRFRACIFQYFLPSNCGHAPKWFPAYCQTAATLKVGTSGESHKCVVKAAEMMADDEEFGVGKNIVPQGTSRPPTCAGEAPTTGGEDLDEGKVEALLASAAEADEQDNAELMKGIQQSKVDAPVSGIPLSADGVVVLRLTRMARSPQVLELLQTTALLMHCRQRVAEAGCSIQPPWAEGAKLLVPLTEEHLAEAEIDLAYNHIVALASDVDAVKAALRELNCKGKTRPKLAAAEVQSNKQARSEDCGPSTVSVPLVSEDRPAVAFDQTTANEMIDADELDCGVVEVEVVNTLALRTDSSLGFPEYPYCG
eukprot:TRINITY_DN66528_c0_g1_i1.p1 TRINITY_DN66528_c0_g1~~TRINITY_DN66528_c0_g1_i1.p1  ORF type:complete len:708 (-),score=108.20 TRINITY_DN66528_c0_g1_i1:29-2152(-)